jgi:hypothetical protein
MTADPVTLSLIASGVGTAMQMQSQQDQAARKRSVMNRQLERNDQMAQKSGELVQSEADNFDPAKRKAAMEDQQAQNFDASMGDLKSGAGGADVGAVQTSGDAGNVSEDFIKAKAGRAATEGQRITDIAKELSKTRAPNQLLQTEGQRRGDMASSLQNLFGANQNMANATSNDADTVMDDGTGALGSLASSIGTSVAAGKIARGAAPGIDFIGIGSDPLKPRGGK